MNAKSTIRKILFISVWLLIGGGMISLLLAAINKKNKGVCSNYVISFRSNEKNSFINSNDVEKLLFTAANGNLKGRLTSSLNLHELEQALENNSWIDQAELYFDNQNVLHVKVSEKKPVARIFTISDQSFYLDSMGREIPLSLQTAPKLTVFTGFPASKKGVNDSALLNNVKIIANYISNDAFWKAEVAQIDITADQKFEMVPVVGNHLVRLGDAQDIDKKFRRLFIFYQQVLSKTSFDRYKIIDVQYKGQVVVSRSQGNQKVDSIQLRRNVEMLLKQSIEAEFR